MRSATWCGPLILFGLALCAGFADGDSPAMLDADLDWIRDEAWDDGAAMVSVFRGRLKWYGEWRDAEVRHYIVREYLHPKELVKAEPRDKSSIPVLKANTLISFNTGTYPYRQMSTIFFHRKWGHVVKAVGSSQEGCGASFQRWDAASHRLKYDTYWGGEGAGSRDLTKPARALFENELPFLAPLLEPGEFEILPSLVTSSVRDRSRKRATVEREKGVTRIGERTYRYDKGRFLESWTVPGREEFKRVSKKRLYYWNHTKNGDEKLLEAK
ncbi:MAG: hypothetical protein ACYTGZ_01965 [Planctomycetota bacterium]|jgi:hypothetical protein